MPAYSGRDGRFITTVEVAAAGRDLQPGPRVSLQRRGAQREEGAGGVQLRLLGRHPHRRHPAGAAGGAGLPRGGLPLGDNNVSKTRDCLCYTRTTQLCDLRSLLVAARAKNPQLGFCPDFVEAVAPHLADIKRRGLRVVTNGGGINPAACAAALAAIAKKESENEHGWLTFIKTD